MSHYSVGVICKNIDDIDDILASYWEELEVAPYINRTKAEMIKEAKETKEKYTSRTDLDVEQHGWVLPWLNAETDEDFYNAEKDESIYDYDVNGNEMTTYNPNSKWDWYSIGGRWGDKLKVRITEENGLSDYAYDETDEFVYCDAAKIKDIDFSINKEEYDGYLQWWKDNIEAPDDEWKGLYKKEYYTERYKSAEEYATRNASFSTFALVTPDGKWHECGEMGWFGCSSETPEEAKKWDEEYMSYIKNANPEYYFVMVDCHI